MGITGLIPFLDKASSKINIRDIRGSTVAIDTYCWLHKGASSCADKICRGEDTDLYIQYCLKYVNLLLDNDIKPILVFDGRHLPAKSLTEKRRRESREQSKKRAVELLRIGKTDEAKSHMRRCVDITHEMALRLIKECRKRNVDCIVAPYEADAQMAYLNKINIAEYIITEDSDLVLFGCKKIIFKFDLTGNGILVDANKLHLAMGCRIEKFSFDKFRIMCILSGCDYLDSLPGIGLAKACKFVLKTEETIIPRALLKIPQYLNMRQLHITEDYIENFLKAISTFKHMYVYDPFKRTMVRLNELSELATDEKYCSNAGTNLENDIAFQLALGNINPFSLKTLDNWNPDQRKPLGHSFSNFKIAKHRSIWQVDFKAHVPKLKMPNSRQDFMRCALEFKKVNYVGIVDGETKIDENDGQNEGEIISLYREGEEIQQKFNLLSSNSCNENAQSEPTSVKKHNPFAIIPIELTTSLTKQNTSLLKCLSPKKPTGVDNNSQKTRFDELCNMKRTLIDQTQEVKSRFFASNITSVLEKSVKTDNLTNEELEKQVLEIESISQEKLAKEALLREDSLSPISSKRKDCIRTNDEMSPLAKRYQLYPSITNDMDESQIPKSIDSGIGSSERSSSSLSLDDFEFCSPKKEELKTFASKAENEIIVISDNDCSLNFPSKQRTIAMSLSNQRTRGVGLSKSKTRKKSVPDGQTRLSMFGFKKRPSLK